MRVLGPTGCLAYLLGAVTFAVIVGLAVLVALLMGGAGCENLTWTCF